METITRIVVMGKRGVGKTTILHKLLGPEEWLNSAEESSKICSLGTHSCQIIERKESPTLLTTKMTAIGGIILVVDVSEEAFSKDLEEGYNKIKTEYPETPIIIIANKKDLLASGAQDDIRDRLGRFSKEHQACRCYFWSSYAMPQVVMMEVFRQLSRQASVSAPPPTSWLPQRCVVQ